MSTATSIVVAWAAEPFGVGVVANGQAVPVAGWIALGSGVDGSAGPTRFWQLDTGMLTAHATYVVTLPNGAQDGGSSTLTTFSTAAGYDKTAGTPATLRGVHLCTLPPVGRRRKGSCIWGPLAEVTATSARPSG